MKTYNCLMIAILALLVYACKKDEQGGIRDQRLKDAVNINTGSWFVYEDSASGREDSFVVSGFTHSLDGDGRERYQVTMQDTADHLMTIRADGNGEKGSDKISFIFSKNGQQYMPADLLQFEFPDPPPGAPLSYGDLYRYHPTYEVGGKTFREVYESLTEYRIAIGDTDSRHLRYIQNPFFSPEEGLVKFTAVHPAQGAVYRLRRYQILR